MEFFTLNSKTFGYLNNYPHVFDPNKTKQGFFIDIDEK
jgi:hypothetical protein